MNISAWPHLSLNQSSQRLEQVTEINNQIFNINITQAQVATSIVQKIQ